MRKQTKTQPKTSAQVEEKPQTMAVEKAKRSALDSLADRLQVDRDLCWNVLKQTAFRCRDRQATKEELVALIVVANQYGLNPLTKELYAFPDKRGGIVPVVSVDGWARIINDQKAYDNCEFEEEIDDEGKPVKITCIMHRKDRTHPCKVTEYYKECYRPTDPWNNMPCRMLRHKALMQCARYAFGFGGIYDEDEARDIVDITATAGEPKSLPEITPLPDIPVPQPPPQMDDPGSDDGFNPRNRDLELPEDEDDSQDPPPDDIPMGESEPEPEPSEPPPPPPPPARPSTAPATPKIAGKASYSTVIGLCKADGVNTMQMMAWAKEQGIADEKVRFASELDEATLQTIIKNWGVICDHIKETEAKS